MRRGNPLRDFSLQPAVRNAASSWSGEHNILGRSPSAGRTRIARRGPTSRGKSGSCRHDRFVLAHVDTGAGLPEAFGFWEAV